jgi:hypothetical protein
MNSCLPQRGLCYNDQMGGNTEQIVEGRVSDIERKKKKREVQCRRPLQGDAVMSYHSYPSLCHTV